MLVPDLPDSSVNLKIPVHTSPSFY